MASDICCSAAFCQAAPVCQHGRSGNVGGAVRDVTVQTETSKLTAKSLEKYLSTYAYGDYLALSQWQRFVLVLMNIRSAIQYRIREGCWRWGFSMWVVLVIAPFNQWRLGFDQSQETESLAIGPVRIVWTI